MPVHTRSTAVGAIAAIAATHVAVDLVGGGFAAMIPTIAERMSLSSTTVGVLVALFSVSALGSQPFMVGLADRFGARRVTAIAAGVAAALLAAAAVVANRRSWTWQHRSPRDDRRPSLRRDNRS